MYDMNDEIISSISYTKINRTIEFNQQKSVKTEHRIMLYESKILTSSHQFKIENVFDISYRVLSEDSGFLYLHTNQGVFAFVVTSDPSSFMEKVKDCIKRG